MEVYSLGQGNQTLFGEDHLVCKPAVCVKPGNLHLLT